MSELMTTHLRLEAAKVASEFPPAIQSMVRDQVEAAAMAALDEHRRALAQLAKEGDPDETVAPLKAKLTVLVAKRAKLDTERTLLQAEAAQAEHELRRAHIAAEQRVRALRRAAMPTALVTVVRNALQGERDRLQQVASLEATPVKAGKDGLALNAKLFSSAPAARRLNDALTLLDRAIGDLVHMADGVLAPPQELEAWVATTISQARRCADGA